MLELLPLITAIINNSITSGVYPCLYGQAIVRPLLKKRGWIQNEYKNYRPVSHLFFTSKLIEKAVSLQLEHYLSQNNLLDIYKSGYRMYHSTKTALLKITNDILMNQNKQCSTALVTIDLSTTFDLVNHSILLERLDTSRYVLWNQGYDIEVVPILFIWSYAASSYKWGLFHGEHA